MDGEGAERAIRGEVVVDAPLEQVWEAWTTAGGIRGFFAPECNLEIQPGGAFEILFNPDEPAGQRGAEGMRVLAVQPHKMLSFTWNSPPSLAEVRDQMTHVTVRFVEAEGGRTRLTLHHGGWGSGGQWDQAFDYFERAWKRVVLPRLRYRFEQGPVDWEDPPGLDRLAPQVP